MSMKSAVVAVALWLGSLVLAFSVGRGLWQNSSRDQAARVPPPATPSVVASENVSDGGEAPSVAPATPTAAVVATAPVKVAPQPSVAVVEPGVGESLAAAFREADPLKRMNQFAAVLGRLNADNIGEAVMVMEDLPHSFENWREMNLLLYAWARIDGAAAMAYVHDSVDRGMQRWGAYSVLSGWASADPDAAIAWAQTNYEGEDNPYMLGVIRGLAQKDLARAASLVESLPRGRNRGRAVATVLDRYFAEDATAAVAWAENLPEGELREGVAEQVAGRLTDVDLEAAIKWALSRPAGDEYDRATAEVADHWSRRAPLDAAEWAGSLEQSTARAAALRETIENWARQDAEAAGVWLGNYPAGTERDQAVAAYAYRIRREFPDRALEWAQAITSEEQRNQVVERLSSPDRGWGGGGGRGRGGGGPR